MRRPQGAFASNLRQRFVLPRLLTLFTAIPFALMSNTWQVHMALRVENDGSALRQITADASPYFRSSRSDEGLPKWVNDVQAGGQWDMEWRTDTPTSFRYARDMRLPSVDRASDSGQLSIVDVVSNPLSLYTTYTWHEEVNFVYHSETDPSAAGATGKELIYRVEMPGTVTDASIEGGGSSETEANHAVFKVSADTAEHAITVTAQRLRWGYLLLVLYIVAFIAYQVLTALGRAASRRPRKI
ncbi:MAG: hypothetical protein ABFD96_04710 [Armatimonadia bacterium]